MTATPASPPLAPPQPPPLAPGGIATPGWPVNGRYHPSATPPPPAAADHQPLGGRLLSRGFGAYYLAVALVAAAGQVSAATYWSGWHLLGVIPLVAVLEFGGVVMAARADERRRMGERAYAALAISSGVAAMAAAINFAGHMAAGQAIAAWVFASLTLLGYAIWLVDTGYRRRDAMRASGKMRAGRPAYGWRWIKPRVTLLALEIWRKDQDRLRRQRLAPEAGMSVDESWTLARVARVTRREIRHGGGGGGYDEVALALYDPAKVAELSRALVDHEALARRIAERVSVDAIDAAIARSNAGRRAPWRRTATPASATPAVPEAPATPTAPAPAPAPAEPPPAPPVGRQGGGKTTRRRQPAKRPAGGRQAPSMDQLIATIGERHPGERVSLPVASATLRDVYQRCSDVRARAARDGHNERLDSDQEGDAA